MTEKTHAEQKKPESQSLAKCEKGGSFMEKLIITGLFVFVVGAVVGLIGSTAANKMQEQNDTLDSEVTTSFGGN